MISWLAWDLHGVFQKRPWTQFIAALWILLRGRLCCIPFRESQVDFLPHAGRILSVFSAHYYHCCFAPLAVGSCPLPSTDFWTIFHGHDFFWLALDFGSKVFFFHLGVLFVFVVAIIFLYLLYVYLVCVCGFRFSSWTSLPTGLRWFTQQVCCRHILSVSLVQ